MTDQQQPQHCTHWKMCYIRLNFDNCPVDMKEWGSCNEDTRTSHSSATEPAKGVACLTCFHCHKQVSTYHKGLVFRGTAICPECTDKYGEHDATIAQAAREEVLDELAEPTIRASEEAEENGDYVSQTCYEDVLKWVASLRSGGK